MHSKDTNGYKKKNILKQIKVKKHLKIKIAVIVILLVILSIIPLSIYFSLSI
jgi:hypothetical protein